MLETDFTNVASIAATYVQDSVLYLFITVNSPVISAICMDSCVFIGRSHKNVKFFLFLCRIIKKVFNCFCSVEKTFSTAKRSFSDCHFRGHPVLW